MKAEMQRDRSADLSRLCDRNSGTLLWGSTTFGALRAGLKAASEDLQISSTSLSEIRVK